MNKDTPISLPERPFAPITRPTSSPTRDLRVLIAEDTAAVRDLLCEALHSGGFSVTAVPDGTQAIEALGSQAFDILVTDFAMPGYDGLQVAKACKRQRPEAKVIMLTAWDLWLKESDCIESGVDVVVPKPVGLPALFAALHQVRESSAC